ncbi:Hsp20/alpha crystallin family protein [Candidatus Pacearchaeota archaeon]|nr:Hsp20/alpha crystallin family protein [Candidatus Pacearchaeota archaeon]
MTIEKFRGDISRAFDEALSLFSRPFSPTIRSPLTDLKETDKELIAYLEIPGVEKKDIELNVTKDRLEAKVERTTEKKEEKGDYHVEERSYVRFYRSMALPHEVLPDQVKANYKDGVLEVVMPKAEKKDAKKVDVE